MRAYYYLFYRLYDFGLKRFGEADIPEYNAVLGISLLSYMNLISVFSSIEAITGIRIFNLPEISILQFALFFTPFICIHYFLLVVGGKHKKIRKQFVSESDSLRTKHSLYIFLYIVSTIIILFLSWYFVYLRNR